MVQRVQGKNQSLPVDHRGVADFAVVPQSKVVGKGPFLLLLVYLGFEFIRPQFFAPVIAVIRPGLILGIAMTLCWLKVWGPKSLYRDVLLRYYLFILAFALIWVPFAHNNYWALQRFLELLTYFLGVTIPMSLILRDTNWRQKFITFWIIIHVYLAIFSLTHGGKGPGSFLLDENDLALALCMCIPYPFFLSQLKSNNLLRRALYIAAALVMIVGVIWTNSRGGFVGLVCVTVYMLWLSKHRFRNLLLLSILAASALFFTPNTYIEEVRSITDKEGSTRRTRILHWQIGWEMFQDNPVFGVGPGNYPWRAGYYQRQLDSYRPGDRIYAARAAHSLYFTVIPEYGLVGTIPCVLILLGMFRRLKRCEQRDPVSDENIDEKDLMVAKSIRASIVGYLTAGAFISVFYYPHFWYSIGLVIALCGFHANPTNGLRSENRQV